MCPSVITVHFPPGGGLQLLYSIEESEVAKERKYCDCSFKAVANLEYVLSSYCVPFCPRDFGVSPHYSQNDCDSMANLQTEVLRKGKGDFCKR